eukprot:gene720-4012_t
MAPAGGDIAIIIAYIKRPPLPLPRYLSHTAHVAANSTQPPPPQQQCTCGHQLTHMTRINLI